MWNYLSMQAQASIKDIDAPLNVIGGEIVEITKLLEILQQEQKHSLKIQCFWTKSGQDKGGLHWW